MNLSIKLSSEKQKEIEIVEEGFLDLDQSGSIILMELQTNEEPSDIMWTWKSKYMAKLKKSNYWQLD